MWGKAPNQASAGLWRKTAQFADMTQSARLGQVGARWRKSESHARKHSVARSRGTYPCCCLWFLHSHAAILKLTR